MNSSGGEDIEELGMKMWRWPRELGEERCLMLVLLFFTVHILLNDQWTNFSQSECVLSMMVTGKWSPWLHLKLWSFSFLCFSYFLHYCLWLLYSQVTITCEEPLLSWKRLNNCLLVWKSEWIILLCFHIQILLCLLQSLSTKKFSSFLTFTLLIFSPIQLLGSGRLCTSIKPILV